MMLQFVRSVSASVALFALALLFSAAPLSVEGYPILANYYLSAFEPYQNNTLVPALARYDLLILDMEMGERNPQAISGIRQLNPEVKILAYMTCQQITVSPDPLTEVLRDDLFDGIDPSWWLQTNNGDRVTGWPGTEMLNCSVYCPQIGGQTWNGYFASFITGSVLSNPCWDGFFVDNCWSTVPTEMPDFDACNLHLIDCNADSVIDPRAWLDQQWKAGMDQMLAQLRQANPGKLIVGNAGYDFGAHLNGAMFEEWDDSNPDNGFGFDWGKLLWMQADLPSQQQAPTLNVAIARQPGNLPTDFRHLRLSLSAALLSDVYHGIDKGPEAHADTWWYDEFDYDLGQPLETLELLGPEQMINGGFASLAGWSAEVISPLSWENHLSLGNENGNTFARCNIANTDSLDWHFALKQTNNPGLTFTYGQQYFITFRAKADHPRPIELVIMKETENWQWLMPAPVLQLDTVWQTFEYLVTPSTTNIPVATDIRFAFFLGQEDGSVCIDDVSMRRIDADRALQRRFANGLAICNPTSFPVTVGLDGTYHHIQGHQDPAVNNGQPCTSVTVPAFDGVILLNYPPPALLSPEPWIRKTAAGIEISWPPVSGAGQYVLQCSANPQSGFVTLATTTLTRYTDISGQKRFYRVIAVTSTP